MSETKRLAKELMRLENQMFSISDTADTLSQATEGLAKSIGTAANESKIWTAASRILSGTGLWKLQNYLRGGIQLLTFYKDAQAKAIESQNESMKSLAALSDEYVTVNQKTKELQGILKNGTGFKEAIKDNLELKLQMDSMAKAIEDGLITQEDAEERAAQRTLKIYEYQGKQMQKLLEKRNKLVEKAIKEEEKMEELKRARQLKAELKEAKKALRRTGGADPLFRLRKSNVKALEAAQAGSQSKLGELGGTGASAFAEGMKGVFDPFIKLYNKKESFKENLAKIRDKLTLGAMSKLGKVAGLALKYSIMFVLFLMGAFVIFSIIRKIMENAESMQVVMDTISNVMSAVFMVVEGFMLIFSAFFGSEPIGKRFMMLLEGMGKIIAGVFGGLGAILLGVGKLVVGFIITGIFGVIEWLFVTGGKFVYGIFEKTYEIFRPLGEAIGNIIGVILTFIGGFFDMAYRILVTPINFIIRAVVGALNMMPLVNFTPPQLAKGGLIGKGGLAIVGEEGPELVNLPTGAKVNSNSESRKMVGGNTIHVHVNGRLGASDSELRDIAKKVGRMVSAEINRSTSSSTNVRY